MLPSYNFLVFSITGVIRSLQARDALDHVYCTETRPYNQGSRLTAFELVHDKIAATLVADSMVALLFKSKQVSGEVIIYHFVIS